ncbi:secondary thiamine-phosphate synthase enzyme YjbQ [Aurantimonas sp. MSK8Z-1]|uniref:secondary thiamine-phosphate synthase enzyme YjbQ n=1 Tax=Mangrovibrevibacter kandeliae TaxID=2968473 RepID=UPI002118A83F|nr:secondary thiamine-phosphate synthase enzyme YjbQ [Aurantimonas sp. MSK8Z-1]MCW4116176.1 secondary thiamine-phosphate synthase enzyme YjbQ [Aurantimonas sp. MSK8Z-1]
MRQAIETLTVQTRGRSMQDVSAKMNARLRDLRVRDGLLTVFIRHTSASLVIQENADPDVRDDLLDALDQLAPQDAPYRHDVEGPDDMPAHVKAAITATSIAIPVQAGRMMLGSWQGLYVVEHRARPHERQLVLHFAGSFEGEG